MILDGSPQARSGTGSPAAPPSSPGSQVLDNEIRFGRDGIFVKTSRDNTFARNVFGVKVKVSDSLAMKAGLETRFNSRVEAGIRNTDNLTTVNLVYDFK